ncbi:MAG: hypothetical protein NW203_11080 [Hyphomonadaceae bacterium]|nr:hypothetical protein [Hyphomonadaceae bacterium]
MTDAKSDRAALVQALERLEAAATLDERYDDYRLVERASMRISRYDITWFLAGIVGLVAGFALMRTEPALWGAPFITLILSVLAVQRIWGRAHAAFQRRLTKQTDRWRDHATVHAVRHAK